jgi:hypothetical protein
VHALQLEMRSRATWTKAAVRVGAGYERKPDATSSSGWSCALPMAARRKASHDPLLRSRAYRFDAYLLADRLNQAASRPRLQ